MAPGAQVLIVEDNSDIRQLLTSLLCTHFHVLIADNSEQGLRLARRVGPDLVLTGVSVRRQDGLVLRDALQADPATARIPVIVLSAGVGEDGTGPAGGGDSPATLLPSESLRERLRASLAEAGQRLRSGAWRAGLLDALSDGFFVMDGAGTVTDINQGFTDILGYGREGLPYVVPHPWRPDPRTHPEEHRRLELSFAGALTGGQHRWSLQLRHRDGRLVYVDGSSATTRSTDADGHADTHIVGVLRDVTEQHRAAQRNALLADTARLLTEPGDVAGKLDAICALAAQSLGELVVMARTAPDGSMPIIAAAHPHRPDLAEAMRPVGPYRMPQSIELGYRDGKPVILDPIPIGLVREALGDSFDAREALGFNTTLLAPLAVADRVLGLILIISPPGGRRFDDADLRLTEELARRVSGVIDADRIAGRERQLHEVSAQLAAATTLTESARVLATAMARAFGADGVAVYAVHPDDPGHLYLEHQIGYSAEAEVKNNRVSLEDEYAASKVALSGEAVWLSSPDALRPHVYVAELIEAGPVRAGAALPLIVGSRVLGVVGMSFTSDRTFSPDERAFAGTLVAQAAQAVDRAASADARWRVAEILQQALLPTIPSTSERLAVATRYLPAVHDLAAGGDWYDLIRLDADRSALVVGDVVGHGAPAAAIMGQLRSVLASRLVQGESPGRALDDLNRYAATLPAARASTAACVLIDTGAMTLRWACAGHPQPLLLRPADPEQPARYLQHGRGPLLGCVTTAPGEPLHSEGEVPLHAGDTVLLYTDGLIERRGEVIDIGFDRLFKAATKIGNVTPEALVDGLLAASELDGNNPDDVALIAARVLPGAVVRLLPARPDVLRGLRREVAGWAAAAGLDDDQIYDLQLALGEAAANAIEHAYSSGPVAPVGSSGSVVGPEFEYRLAYRHEVGVDVVVRDFGRWRQPPEDSGHRGRGLALLDSLARDVSLDRTTAGTTVGFTVPSPPPAPTGTRAPAAPSSHDLGQPAEFRPTTLDPLVLGITGDLNLAGLPKLRAELLAHVSATYDRSRVVLDLRDVGFVSSAGIALLFELADLDGAHLEVRHRAGTPVARIFELTSLDAHPAITLTMLTEPARDESTVP